MNDDLHIGDVGIAIIAFFEASVNYKGMMPEGLDRIPSKYLTAYLDTLATKHIWTIGFGNTPHDYPWIKEGARITEEQAYDMLRASLAGYENQVKAAVKVPLTQNQFDALVSWTYNLGSGNLRRSTMLKRINEGRWDDAYKEMRKWNRAGGKVRNGLVKRRMYESNVFRYNFLTDDSLLPK